MFSVIIPVYNRGNLVSQAIDSVLSQTFDDYELIIVDDGSTDNTPQVLAGYANRVRVITHSNQGPEITRNAGAAVATGEYLAFLDSDDLMFPCALETYDRVIAAMDQPALLLSCMIFFKSVKPVIDRELLVEPIELVSFKDVLSKDCAIEKSSSKIVVKKDVFNSVGGFRHIPSPTFPTDDIDFLLMAGIYGPAIVIKQPATVAYRIHENNVIHDIRFITQGVMSLIRSEKKGIYPGGSSRRFERYSFIGGSVFFWSRTALQKGFPLLSLQLLLSGFPMVIAGALQKLRIKIRGIKPTTKLKLKNNSTL